jgi:hypothetical protein
MRRRLRRPALWAGAICCCGGPGAR